MAAAPIEFTVGIAGLTGATVSLFDLSSIDPVAAVSGVAMTDGTNEPGTYSGTTTAALTGVHRAYFKNSGGVNVDVGYVVMSDDTAIHRVVSTSDVADKTGLTGNAGSIAAAAVQTILTTAMTEAYAADGAAPTLAQALMLIQQMLTEFLITGDSLVVKKLDGSTTAATITLNSATLPTGATRAS